MIEFDQKRAGMRPIAHPDVTEDIVEQMSDHFVSNRSLAARYLITERGYGTLDPGDGHLDAAPAPRCNTAPDYL